tara:strand:- start:4425 stop:5432 length:1008 start_codon:yes stop_codon:yes gene_type:complete
MKQQSITFLILSLFSTVLSAHPWTASRPDGHAPLGVMGDHMHAKGEWMASYRFMSMDMDGLRSGSNDVTVSSQLGMMKYGMVPTKMTMDMHMFGAMHAVSDKLTVMGMVNYIENDMDMKMMSGMTSSVKNSGLGDLKISGLYDLKTWDHDRRLHLNLGLSLPIGSIKEKDSSGFFGYPMQLGSGTWDLLPGITYLGQSGDYSYGAQASGVLRIGENSRNYTLGENVAATVWGARKLSDSLSVSLRLRGLNTGNVDGEDADIATRLASMMDSPSFDPSSRGREEVNLGLGVNYYIREGQLKGHRFAVEWETPIKEDFDGVQMKIDSIWTVGWQYAW